VELEDLGAAGAEGIDAIRIELAATVLDEILEGPLDRPGLLVGALG